MKAIGSSDKLLSAKLNGVISEGPITMIQLSQPQISYKIQFWFTGALSRKLRRLSCLFCAVLNDISSTAQIMMLLVCSEVQKYTSTCHN
jgi:hypothetical protein